MQRVRLVHWKEAELGERVARLERVGYAVDAWGTVDGPGLLRALRDAPPAAVVIDLSRLPSHGREVAVALRTRASTRRVPLVFVDGQAAKVQRVRDVLPDAVFTSWRGIRGALARAIARPPADPVKPAGAMASYSRSPLPKKLGMRPGARVALVGAPSDFEKTLGSLPEGVVLRRRAAGTTELTLWFVRRESDLCRGIDRMATRADQGGLWIVWPKQGSPLAGDLTQNGVRQAGLAAGLVDYKICAVDDIWSALRFTRRA